MTATRTREKIIDWVGRLSMRRTGRLMLALAAIAPVAHGIPRLAIAILLLGGGTLTLASYTRLHVRWRTRRVTDPFGNPAEDERVASERARASRPS